MPTTGAALGAYPLGYGEPAEAPMPPEPTKFSRYINPGTKSFQIDAETRGLAQMPGTRQRVLIALSAARGSSTVRRELGLRFGGKIGENFVNEMQGEVRHALRFLLAERALRLERVEVEKRSVGRLRIIVTYTDLATGETGQQVTTTV